MVVYLLWALFNGYAVMLGQYPSPGICTKIGGSLETKITKLHSDAIVICVESMPLSGMNIPDLTSPPVDTKPKSSLPVAPSLLPNGLRYIHVKL